MRLSTKKRRQELRFGQATLLGVAFERVIRDGQMYWYAYMPSSVGGPWHVSVGPWPTRWQAVNAALDRLEVFRRTEEGLPWR